MDVLLQKLATGALSTVSTIKTQTKLGAWAVRPSQLHHPAAEHCNTVTGRNDKVEPPEKA